MQLSARNQLTGTIVSIVRGPVTAMVKIDVAGQHVSATLTSEAADELGLIEGMEVVALFKASAVILGVD
jgi:molybdate transport system regulatory protein